MSQRRPALRRRAVPRLLFLAATAAACGDAGPEAPVRTDSAGVALVVNGAGDRALDWTFERILDLGGEDSGPTAFFRVIPTSVGVDAAGNLFVLDAGNYSVSVFDRSGRLVRTWGRQGAGPGELEFPSDMAVAPSGRVAVHDFAKRALVLFDPDGSYTGMVPLPGPLQRQVALLDDGTPVAAVTQPVAGGDSADFRLLALGSPRVELAGVRVPSRFPAREFECGPVARPPYFAPRVVWSAAGRWVAFSDDAGYKVRVVEGGGLAAVWRRDVPEIPATLELAAWEVADGDSLRVRRCAVPADEAARKIGYGEVAPRIAGLAVTPEGGVWVQRRTAAPGERPIDVVDATGAYVGTLPSGSPFPALFRDADEVVSVEKDELDRTHVVVYRIRRRPSAAAAREGVGE